MGSSAAPDLTFGTMHPAGHCQSMPSRQGWIAPWSAGGPLRHRNQDPRRRGFEWLGQCCRPSRLEIKLDPELAHSSKFATVGVVVHSMQKADRRIAEMQNPGFDEHRAPQL